MPWAYLGSVVDSLTKAVWGAGTQFIVWDHGGMPEHPCHMWGWRGYCRSYPALYQITSRRCKPFNTKLKLDSNPFVPSVRLMKLRVLLALTIKPENNEEHLQMFSDNMKRKRQWQEDSWLYDKNEVCSLLQFMFIHSIKIISANGWTPRNWDTLRMWWKSRTLWEDARIRPHTMFHVQIWVCN